MKLLRGAGGGGSSSQHTPVESPDSLHSIAYAHILDMVSEGQIVGLANGLQSIYFDQTPLKNADGSMNFNGVQVDSRVGTLTQDYVKGFPDVENVITENVELTYTTSFVRASTNLTLSAVRVTLSVPQLAQTNATTGDTTGYIIQYAIDVSTDGGAYVQVVLGAFNGKTTTKYQRSHRIDLPPAASTGWNIRVRRLTVNGTSSLLLDKTFVDSITEVIDLKLRYPNSALVGVVIDASQFQNIPVRGYHLKGRIIRVPSNYNAVTRVYTGIWDGTFQTAYTNNPAWIFFDLATNARYGLGNYLVDAQLDKWGLYTIAQYCDGYVPSGVKARGTFTTGSVTLAANPPTAGVGVTGAFSTGIFTATAHGFAANDPVQFSGIAFGAGTAVTGASATGIFTATAHGFSLNDQVQFYSITGGAGIIPDQVYYVISANLAANTFEVSTTTGGPSITFSSDMTAGTVVRKGGSGIVAGTVYYVIAANLATNTFSVSATYGGSSIVFNQNLTAGTVTRASSYTRTTGSFVTDGFAAPDEINATGFATAGNNGRGVILAVNPLQIVIDGTHPLTSDVAAAGRTLAVQAFTEPRFTCNAYLQAQGDAYKVLQDLASTFRGISYWAGGLLSSVADQPGNPVYTYTAANVVDGKFNYSGSAKKTRATVALVSWNDPNNFYKAAVEYVEDLTGIARYGVQQVQVTAFGCTSQSQARRVGNWTLLTGRLETDLVSFDVGMEGTFAMPGQIIRVADEHRAGKRIAGRVLSLGAGPSIYLLDQLSDRYIDQLGNPLATQDSGSGSVTSVTVDQVVGISAGDSWIVQMPDGTLQTMTVASVSGNTITMTAAFSPVPAVGAVWVTESSTLVAQQYRVLSVAENTGHASTGTSGDITFTITAVQHDSTKFALIENGVLIQEPPTTSLPNPVQLPVASVTLTSFERASNFSSHTVVEASYSFAPGAVTYAVQWQKDNSNWTTPIQKSGNIADYENAAAGSYVCKVSAVGPNGKSSIPVLSAPYTIVAASTPPIDTTAIALSIVSGVVTVDCSISNHFTLSLSANATLRFVGVPNADHIRIEVTQSGGSHTLTMPSGVQPVNGVQYVASTTAGQTDLLDLSTFNNGATWALTYVTASSLVVSLSPSPASGTANSLSGALVSPSVTVTASYVGNSGAVTYLWTRADSSSGAINFVISSTTAAAPAFSIASTNVAQSYSNQWLCTATDAGGHVSTALVTITLSVTTSGTSPLTVACTPASISQIITLSHSSSNSTAAASGGTGTGFTYSWVKTSGSANVALTNATSATATFTLSSGVAGNTYTAVFTVTATDSGSNTATQTVNYSVEVTT